MNTKPLEVSEALAVSSSDIWLTNAQQDTWLGFRFHPLHHPNLEWFELIESSKKPAKIATAPVITQEYLLLAVLEESDEPSSRLDADLVQRLITVFTEYYEQQSSSGQTQESSINVTPTEPLVKLYMLRIVLKAGAIKEFISYRGYRDDGAARYLGVDYLEKNDGINLAQLKFVLNEQLKALEALPIPFDEVMEANLTNLQHELALSDVDIAIFRFTLWLHASSELDNTADMLGALTAVQVNRVLAIVLNLPEEQIDNAMSQYSALMRTGLVKVDRDGAHRLRSKLELINRRSFDLLMDRHFKPMDLVSHLVKPSESAELGLDDYPHFDKELAVILPYLTHSLAHQQKGVNIFLYGEPGTGKTQLVRTLAQALSVSCYEVSTSDEDGDPISGEKRLQACAGGQVLLKDNPCLLMFDEAEDVFSARGHREKSPAEARKAWFNNLLEKNDVPTIWISNQHHGIDAAFIRRFDLVLEMPMPAPSQRAKMIAHYGQGMVSEEATERFAKHSHLSPAIIERTAKVVKPIAAKFNADETDATFELLVNHTLVLQSHDKVESKKQQVEKKVSTYNPAYMNANSNMLELAEMLKQHTSARLCLYGPPGTGKTAYGHYLAEQLERPLHIKKASDLLSMFVGGTEANLASAFRDASSDNAILLIDEVDSFISDRSNAVRSWEVTAINEMLTQMEAYEGLFIATTNRMDGLDPAALRRFDLKVKVDYLTYQQRIGLFNDTCQQLSLTSDESLNDDLISLTNLTPGDFALVVRQSRFRPIHSAKALFDALADECQLKGGNKARVGF